MLGRARLGVLQIVALPHVCLHTCNGDECTTQHFQLINDVECIITMLGT